MSNDEQRQYWNDMAGPAWAASADRIDRTMAALGRAAMDGVVTSGMSVLDVGCGSGGTTLELAERVGSEGRVVGLDVSEPMLAVARGRGGPTHVTFVRGDAQYEDFTPTFDLVFSRFGVMFFSEPEAAFENLVSALRPGGQLSVVTWQAAERNPWLSYVQQLLAEYDPPEEPPDPDGPSPFALSDPERLAALLQGAGLHEVTVTPKQPLFQMGDGSIESAIDMVWTLMRIDQRLANGAPEAQVAVRAALHEFYAAHSTLEGVQMPGAAWISRGTKA